ncbi:glycoside hydrolase family 26 protein [Streptomyces sp. QL37]|uniref:glycoside hydrolase family 26 protein n=1 Tax=Streptomyces sp. QL37 TaxID=2093747 RepID=UPI0021CB47FF|nr:glycosyl hydrolase [Streptomyces sp. QL37]
MIRHRAPEDRRPRTYLVLTLAAVAALLTGLLAWFGTPSSGGGDGRTPSPGALPADAATGPVPGGTCAATATLVPPCGAWWGAYVPYAENGSLKDAVYAFEERIGRKLDLLYTYHDMSDTALDGQLLTPDEQILGRDRLLMLAWESTVWREPHHANWTEDQLGWADIASGKHDREIIDPQARRIKAYGKRVFLSFDQEVDARVGDAGTPEEYVAAHRHLHDRFEELGVDNVVWVWTVSGYLPSGKLFERLYPGDDYVDWIGMDQYNYFTCHDTTDWKDFDRSQRPTYEWLRTHISAEKPLMFAEFATVPDPADEDRQREWYEEIPEVARTMPEAKALVHWNRAVPGKGCDLTVDEGPGLEGYRTAGQDDWFKQPVPGR